MLAFSNANRQVDGIKKKSKKIKPNYTKNSSVQPPLPVNITIEKVSKRASTINKEANAIGEKSKQLAIELDKDISTTMVISIQQTRTKLHSKNQAGMVYRISWT